MDLVLYHKLVYKMSCLNRKNTYTNSRSNKLENLSLKSGFRRKMFFPNGNSYWGNWLKGEKSGFGVMSYKNKMLYEGNWTKDLRLGQGRFSQYSPSGKDHRLCYIGGIKEIPNGYGLCHYPDGSYFEGQFLEGRRCGKGRCWYKDGSFYEGTWKNDVHDGIGMLILSNGNRFEGDWKQGAKDGRGAFYHLDKSQIQEGLWQNGIAVISILRDFPNSQSDSKKLPLLQLNPDTPCLTYLNHLLS